MPEDMKLLDAILAEGAAEPEILELPGWKKDSVIRVKAKRPSFYALLAEGAVPNPLIDEMNKLFILHDRSGAKDNPKAYADTLAAIARLSLVEPTWDELTAAGVTLTSDQLTEISLFATEGMDWLLSFRARARGGAGRHGEAVRRTPQPAAGDPQPAAGVDAGRGDHAPDAAAAERRQAAAEENDEQPGNA